MSINSYLELQLIEFSLLQLKIPITTYHNYISKQTLVLPSSSGKNVASKPSDAWSWIAHFGTILKYCFFRLFSARACTSICCFHWLHSAIHKYLKYLFADYWHNLKKPRSYIKLSFSATSSLTRESNDSSAFNYDEIFSSRTWRYFIVKCPTVFYHVMTGFLCSVRLRVSWIFSHEVTWKEVTFKPLSLENHHQKS